MTYYYYHNSRKTLFSSENETELGATRLVDNANGSALLQFTFGEANPVASLQEIQNLAFDEPEIEQYRITKHGELSNKIQEMSDTDLPTLHTVTLKPNKATEDYMIRLRMCLNVEIELGYYVPSEETYIQDHVISNQISYNQFLDIESQFWTQVRVIEAYELSQRTAIDNSTTLAALFALEYPLTEGGS